MRTDIAMESRDGFDLRAELRFDTDSSVNDADCYGPEQIRAWNADEWHFVGVGVIVSKNGVDLHEDWLWGVDYGCPWESDPDAPPVPAPAGFDAYAYAERECPAEMAEEAIAQARIVLARLVSDSEGLA